MSGLAVRQTERAFQGAVIDLAERLGWTCGHFADSRKQLPNGRFVGDRRAAGIPDWLLVRERVLHIELKGPRTRVTPAQHHWLQLLQAAGAEVYLWRAPGDWNHITHTLTERRPPQ